MPSYIDIQDGEIERLAGVFIYKNVTKGKIIAWLSQFEEEHQPIALKLLQQLVFIDTAQIHLACRMLCQIAKSDYGNRLNNVCFMALGSAGKSSGTILHLFRHANGMHTEQFDNKFKYSSEITQLPPTFNGTLVFLDDFIGSGLQATASIQDIVSIAPRRTHFRMLVIAGYTSAINELGHEIDCPVTAVHPLSDSQKLFSDENTAFTPQEKNVLKTYCEKTGSKNPYGYRDIGSLVLFSDFPPNNTPSILIHQSQSWTPLFPRW